MAAQGYANGEGALVTTAEDKSRPSGIYEELLPSQIRLVEVLPGEFEDPIELRIKVVDLEDEPLYDALSYVWHPKDGTVDTSRPLNRAKLVGHEVFLIAIGANLDSAIRHLRAKVSTSSAPQKLWIDALCINQSDSRERNHQVGLMKNIYSSAHQVLIWLGPAVGKSDFCIQVLRSGCLDHQDANRFLQALSALIYRSWFTRLWWVAYLMNTPPRTLANS
ncbi:heterokaryon incompatibility protein-domain-containing protein [Phaeosphaeria sp. MPI-PUGE-AT-0046c]|nr:heterokaryon incompatibility protein-domain-containing protein [Phaeosphaeria sp. MPI-PUGE-AT-0046c]